MEQMETTVEKIEKLDVSSITNDLMKLVDEIANGDDQDIEELESIIRNAFENPDPEVLESMTIFIVIMHVVKEKKPELFNKLWTFSKLSRDFFDDKFENKDEEES